jgi:hypothetical protein
LPLQPIGVIASIPAAFLEHFYSAHVNSMTRQSRFPKIVAAMFCAAWCIADGPRVRADFEIESFTRCSVDSLDNNNNGFVVEEDFQSQLSFVSNQTELPSQHVSSPQPIVPASPSGSSIFKNFGTGFVDGINDSWISSSYGFDPSSLPGFNQNDFQEPQVSMTSYLQSCSMQLERVIRFNNKVIDRESKEWSDENFTEVYWGIRYFQLADRWLFDTSSTINGNDWIRADVDNTIPGPHLGFTWSHAREAWRVNAGGFVQAGQYIGSAAVMNSYAVDLSPGPHDDWPNLLKDSDDRNFITLLSVAKAQASHAINKDVTLHLGCTANYVGDMRYAVNIVNNSSPGVEVRDTATQDLFITTVYTSLEFKR